MGAIEHIAQLMCQECQVRMPNGKMGVGNLAGLYVYTVFCLNQDTQDAQDTQDQGIDFLDRKRTRLPCDAGILPAKLLPSREGEVENALWRAPAEPV